MKIIIAGCGKIGATTLESLVAEGHEITAIDTKEDLINDLTNIHDIMGVPGSATDCDTLMEADVAHAEMFIAATGSDELNMLSCFLARKLGAKQTIARIRNPEYNDDELKFLKQQLELSMTINPDLLAAEELYQVLKLPTAMKVEYFSRRNFVMIELILKEDAPLVGKSLSDLRKAYQDKFLVCAVMRGDTVTIPDGNFVLQAGDRVGLSSVPTEIVKTLRSMGFGQKSAKNVMIFGGSRTAYYLSRRLLNNNNNVVKIVDQDRAVCEELSDLLPKAVIINGDGARRELLLEEGLLNMDAFIALTGRDEQNILVSYSAAALGVPKVIAKVNKDSFRLTAERLELDCTITPRKIMAEALVRYARALENSLGSNVETLYKLMDDKAEALEFNVKDDPRIVRIPLKNLKLKPQILIAGIIRDRTPVIPTGDDIILPKDKVVVLAANQRLQDLSDILR